MATKKKRYTISEAAKRLGVTRAAIHAAIQAKRLKAKKGTFEVERVIRRTLTGWVIEEADLINYEVNLTRQEAGKKNRFSLTLQRQA